MDHIGSPSSQDNSSNTKLFIGFIWLITIVLGGIGGYVIGRTNQQEEKPLDKNVLSAMYEASSSPTPTIQVTPTISTESACQKSGFAQKWEYLTPYVIKEGDSLQSIVEKELKDGNRVNEVMQINGVGPLVVGSTLYLPPSTIIKSSGNIKLVSGRLVGKDTSNWQISFNGRKDGQSILIPSFWFGEIADKDSYQIGDCISVLFDDGFKVFTVTRS